MAEDGRKYNGGNKNAGRKPKAEEQKLIERLTPIMPKAFAALKRGLDDDKDWAVKLAMAYYYGKPKQSMDIQVSSEQPLFNLDE